MKLMYAKFSWTATSVADFMRKFFALGVDVIPTGRKQTDVNFHIGGFWPLLLIALIAWAVYATVG